MGCKVKGYKTKLFCSFSFTLTMWDVKRFQMIVLIDPSTFYLNYVGCKGLTIGRRKRKKILFYLNYVGCKGLGDEWIIFGLPVLP